MISGNSAALRALVGMLAMMAGAAAAADWGLDQLMRELAQVKSARATFVERKHLALLTAPLESSGTLIYTAPDRLEKRTLAPRPESLVLERDRLTLEDGGSGQRRSFALRDYPVVWAFVEGIRSTLAGDLATLSRFYQASLEGGERQWRLTLKPVEPDMQNVVSEIRIGGSRNRVNTIEIIETQGDRSVMTITGDMP